MRRRRPLALLVMAALLAACGSPSAPPGAGGAGPPRAATDREEADLLAERVEYAAALAKYRAALEASPEDLSLRFAVGSVLTHLGRRDEAVAEFRWVVAQGRREQPEVEMAREWLRRAGIVLEPGPERGAVPEAVSAAPSPSDLQGSVRGKTVWPGVTRDSYNLTLQILLQGDDGFTQGKLIQGRTRLGDPYTVKHVPPGTYRLLAQVGAVRLWDTRVAVETDKETVLDLTPDTSPVSPSEFPLPPDR